jgi:secreted Zn-dependent insulinase-like peptidase
VQVVGIVFQYIARLRALGTQEWIFDEARDIASMNFRFKSKSKPISYAYMVASSMQMLPPAHTLSGASLFFEYAPHQIDGASAAARSLLSSFFPVLMTLLCVCSCA